MPRKTTAQKVDDIARGMNYILQEMSVNGDRGIEEILKAQYKRDIKQDKAIAELTLLTQDLRIKKGLKKAWNEYSQHSALILFAKKWIFSKTILALIIFTLLMLEVLTENGVNFIVKLLPFL